MKNLNFAKLSLVLAALFITANASAASFEGSCGEREVYRVSSDEVRMTNPQETFVGTDDVYVSTNGNTYKVNRSTWSAELEDINGRVTPCYLVQ